MIFVVEHEKDGVMMVDVVTGVEDLDTSQYQPVNKIFLCENTLEAQTVLDEIKHERSSK
jgi:hypothetical protein